MIKTEELQTTVTGMSCAGCVHTVQHAIATAPGVQTAEVSLLEGRTRVVYDPAQVSPQELKRRVDALGYQMILADAQDRDRKRALLEARYIKGILARMITAGGITLWLTLAPYILPLIIPAASLSGSLGTVLNLCNWVLASVVYFYCAGGYHMRTLKQLRHLTFTMDSLISAGTTASYLLGIWLMVEGIADTHGTAGMTHHAGHYLHMVGMIMFFVLLGKYIEERAKGKTGNALRSLMALAPNEALVEKEGVLTAVASHRIVPGDVVVLRQGDRVPVDGLLLQPAVFNEQHLTGEPLPVELPTGAFVPSGAVCLSAGVRLSAKRVGSESTLERIVQSVRRAQATKAPIQRIADRISGIFVPIVLSIALVTLLAWWLIDGTSFSFAVYRAITVLVVACPCALGLATPTAITVAVGRASAREGLLIRDAVALERLGNITDIVFDKTGTLTQGEPQVVHLQWADGINPQELRLLDLAERQSTHPLARAVRRAIRSNGTPEADTQETQTVPTLQHLREEAGVGLSFSYGGAHYFVGKPEALLNRATLSNDSRVLLQSLAVQYAGHSQVCFTRESELLGFFALQDVLKPNAPEDLSALMQHAGVQIHLLSGDRSDRTAHIARRLGITHYQGDMLPTDKQAYISDIQGKKKRVVAMVGDGINDSPALAQADLSIAMGTGSAIAGETAQITATSARISAIERAIRLSRATSTVIKQNLFWAAVYNVVMIPVAAGVFAPFVGINPGVGAAAMAMSSVIVVLNSLSLRYRRI